MAAGAALCHGEEHPSAKLTEAQVRSILAVQSPVPWGWKKRIAREYGVSHYTIIAIRRRKVWRHIEVEAVR